jgi:hypothetical protein
MQNESHKILKDMEKRQMFVPAGDRITSRPICRPVSIPSLSGIRSKLSSMELGHKGDLLLADKILDA